MRVGETAPARLPDGTYEGASEYGVRHGVRVELRAGRIVTARLTDAPEKLYTRLAEGVLERVVREQRADVETISGATTSSKLILLAVEDALKTE